MTEDERYAQINLKLNALTSTVQGLADLIQRLIRDQENHNRDARNLAEQLHSERGAAARSALAAEAAWEKVQKFINGQPAEQLTIPLPGTSQ